MKHFSIFIALAVGLLNFAAPAQAGVLNPLITFDENGNGTLAFPGSLPVSMPGVLKADPGPGGLGSALTYNMQGPPSLVAGDLMIYIGSSLDDVIRFNPAGTGGLNSYPASIVFYSNPVDGFDSLADAVSPPGLYYGNSLSLQEIDGSVFYHPTEGQPGYVAGFDVGYNIQSTQPVPEPLTASLFGIGLAGLAAMRRSKKKSA